MVLTSRHLHVIATAVSCVDSSGKSALSVAAAACNCRSVEALLDAGADVGAKPCRHIPSLRCCCALDRTLDGDGADGGEPGGTGGGKRGRRGLFI